MKHIFILFLIVLNLSAARYVCTQDNSFIDWISGEPVDINDDMLLVKYSDLISCQSQCKSTNPCIQAPSSSFYTCALYNPNVSVGGDKGPNLFSSASQCDGKCYIQHTCTEWLENPKCNPVSFTKSNPVTDWTGKTVFTQYNVSWDCDTSTTSHGECLSYTTQIIEDDTTFDTSKVGWETTIFAPHDEVMTSIAEIEQLQHIWSGWSGMCEKGILFDNAWMSDPMTLLSMASMAYTGALKEAYGTAAMGVADKVKSAYNNVASGVTDAFSSVTDGVSSAVDGATNAFTSSGQVVSTVSDSASYVSDATSAINESWQQVKEFWNTELIGATEYTTAVTYGGAAMDVAFITMSAFAEPTDDDFKIADDFMKAQIGQDTGSIAAVNYVQCMAAIGLSFPNTMGHAVDDKESMSMQLLEPWKNPIYLSNNQLAYLMEATSASFVKASYIQLNYDGYSGRYIALTSLAYQQAGQLVCGNGMSAVAMNLLNQAASDQDSGGINGAAMAQAGIQSGLSYLPPPYNLMASIAFRMLTSFSDGDACHNEDISMQWGIQQNKTYRALGHDQCHYIDTECAAKWVWGSCMRKRHHYCCFDQEITRIFVEGIKLQQEKEWIRKSCDDLALEDLKNISFRKCLGNETPAVDKCFPAEKWEELNSALGEQATKNYDPESLINSAIDAMPIGDDPWGARIGD